MGDYSSESNDDFLFFLYGNKYNGDLNWHHGADTIWSSFRRKTFWEDTPINLSASSSSSLRSIKNDEQHERSFIYIFNRWKLKNKCDKTIGKFLRLSSWESLLIFRCTCEGNSVAKLRVNLFLYNSHPYTHISIIIGIGSQF